jgi:predicted transposase YbfD/YdcC
MRIKLFINEFGFTAFATQARLVLASTEVDKKTNEIKAIPALLDLIDMKGSIVSMDAIYCQKDICRQLIDKKADYVLSLKKNHATLYDDVSLYLDTQIKKQAVEIKEEIEKGHGRIEIRRYALSPHIDWLESKEDWIGLKAIGMVESIREINGKQEKQLRYYLTSLTDLTKFSETARGHIQLMEAYKITKRTRGIARIMCHPFFKECHK